MKDVEKKISIVTGLGVEVTKLNDDINAKKAALSNKADLIGILKSQFNSLQQSYDDNLNKAAATQTPLLKTAAEADSNALNDSTQKVIDLAPNAKTTVDKVKTNASSLKDKSAIVEPLNTIVSSV